MALITGSAFRHEGVPIPEEITSGSEFTVMLMEGPGYLTLERKRDPNGFYTFPSSFASHSSSNMVSSVFSPYIIGSYMGPHKSGSLTFTAAHDIDPDTVYVKVASTVENIQVEMDGGVDLDSFIIQVQTDNAGTSADNQFTLPWVGTYDVDWGDGNTDTGVVDTQTHTYATAGTYDVSVTATSGQIYFNNGGDKAKLLDVKQWGTCQWTSMTTSFQGCSNISVLSASDTPNLSNVTSMDNCFLSCTSFNTNINNWDVSNVTSMIGVFYYALSFNQPLNNWDVSNVTNMSSMFRQATSFNENIDNWDVSNVTNFFYMFRQANSFNRNIGGWTLNTTGTVSTLSMFYQTNAFNNGGSTDINNWDTSRVTSMGNMFYYATAFNQPINNWDINQVTYLANFMTNVTLSTANYDALLIAWDAQGAMSYSGTVNFGNSTYTLGGNAEAARTSLIAKWGGIVDGGGVGAATFDIQVKTDNAGTSNNDQFTLPWTGTYDVDWGDGNVDTGVTNTQTHTYATAGTYDVSVTATSGRINFNNGGDKDKLLDIKQWGTCAWTSLSSAYRGCSNLTGTFLDTPDLSSVTSLDRVFQQCLVFNGNISSWNILGKNRLDNFLNGATLFNQDIGGWDTSDLVNVNSALFNTSFDQDISGWDVNQITTFTNFLGGTTLSTVNYDALLIAWDAQGTMSYSGTVNFGSSTYTLGGAAEAARTSLISKWGGIIDGGGV